MLYMGKIYKKPMDKDKLFEQVNNLIILLEEIINRNNFNKSIIKKNCCTKNDK